MRCVIVLWCFYFLLKRAAILFIKNNVKCFCLSVCFLHWNDICARGIVEILGMYVAYIYLTFFISMPFIFTMFLL